MQTIEKQLIDENHCPIQVLLGNQLAPTTRQQEMKVFQEISTRRPYPSAKSLHQFDLRTPGRTDGIQTKRQYLVT